MSIELGRDATEGELAARIELKLGEARRLREISEALGISQERARQVEIKAIRTIHPSRLRVRACAVWEAGRVSGM